VRAARHFTELLVWQIADELRGATFALTNRPEVARHYKFVAQVDDAINSVCRNIAEGFAADTHGQFAWFLRVSRRSLNELKDAYRGAEMKGLVAAADLAEGRRLMQRLYAPLNRFIDYLERTPTQRNRPRSSDGAKKADGGFYYRIE
jgi:four helix bundle protein